jgi:hypothetical protein
MKLSSAPEITALVTFQSFVNCLEIFELNIYLRPFLINQHPIFIKHGNVSLPDKNFQNVHSEEISSVLVYDFEILQIYSTNLVYLTQMRELLNNTIGRYYNKLIWTRFPSFIHIFPNNPDQEVYHCQYQFLLNSGLGLRTRPKINSVIITHENSTIHQKNEAEMFWNLNYKKVVESMVDYYDFALHFKLQSSSRKSMHYKPYLIMTSVSILKFCEVCSPTSKVSLLHFQSCKMSALMEVRNVSFNCISSMLQTVSGTNLNLSRFGIELEAADIQGSKTYGNCLRRRAAFKKDFTFTDNFRNAPVQNLILQELFRGLPVIYDCMRKENKDHLIVIDVKFAQASGKMKLPYDYQIPSYFQNHEAFNFLTCDGVKTQIDFIGYLEPFDAQTWLGTIISLVSYSCTIAILIYQTDNPSFLDSCFLSFLMNFSFLAGVPHTPLKLVINNHLNAIRILMLSWGIATFTLCSVYSSLVTSNVIAPKTIVSTWTEYKQLEQFTKVFGLNNQYELSNMEGASEPGELNPYNRMGFSRGSKVSKLWFDEVSNKLFAKYKPSGYCDMYHGNSSSCLAFRKKSFEFLDSYTYVVRSNVEKLKKMLSVCTNTAYIDTETSINNFLHFRNEDEHLPPMVKGNSFFQQSHYWTISRSWVLKKLISYRLKAFADSGIIGFWEAFCLKYCKQQPGKEKSHELIMVSKMKAFRPQELGSNLISLFFIILILLCISILCFLGERYFMKLCK